MIRSFAATETERVWNDERSPKLLPEVAHG